MRTVIIVVALLAIGWAYYTYQSTGRLPFQEPKPTSTGDAKLDKWIGELKETEISIEMMREEWDAENAREGSNTRVRYEEAINRRHELIRMIRQRKQKLGMPLD